MENYIRKVNNLSRSKERKMCGFIRRLDSLCMESLWLYNLGGTFRQYIKLSCSQSESLSINKSPASITDASLTNYVHSRVSEAIFQEEEEEEEEKKDEKYFFLSSC